MAESDLLARASEIPAKKKTLQDALVLVGRYKVERCPSITDDRSRRACAVGYDWIAAQNRAIVAQLEMMESVLALEKSPIRDGLMQSISLGQFDAEALTLARRAGIIERTFPADKR